MIQFNLLPDVKLKYVKARQLKRRIMSISMMVAVVSIAAVLLTWLLVLGQNKNINDLTKDIAKTKSDIQAVPDLNKILTIQNQLQSLPALHDAKPISSRFFDDVNKLTPASIKLTGFDLDLEQYSLTFTGTAPNLEEVNRFSDTLKFAEFTVEDAKPAKAFSSVVTTLTRSSTNSSFTITAKFDKLLVDAKKQPNLTVPQIVTTRSETEKPGQLFESTGGQ